MIRSEVNIDRYVAKLWLGEASLLNIHSTLSKHGWGLAIRIELAAAGDSWLTSLQATHKLPKGSVYSCRVLIGVILGELKHQSAKGTVLTTLELGGVEGAFLSSPLRQ